MKTYKRNAYLLNKVVHDDYYGQFITDTIREQVVKAIGAKPIMDSTDVRFNDIPLHRWDRLEPVLRHLVSAEQLIKATGRSTLTLSDVVCIAKVAARQYKEAQHV